MNQITDIEIDRVNKPDLPIASGALSQRAAVGIVSCVGAVALLAASYQGIYLLATIGGIFLLGTLYSLPPIRLKRFPFMAAATITAARAIIFNIGIALTYAIALTGRPHLPYYVPIFVVFMLAFMVVISVMKDVPDIKGDQKFKIPTFVTHLGAPRTMLLCRVILTVAYTGMALLALLGTSALNPWILATTHIIALIALWVHASRTDDNDKEQAYHHYIFIWKLYYLEFIIFPMACFFGRT